MIKIIFIISILLVFTLPNNIFAEEIFTTVSHDTDDIVYDGLWSFLFEWKRTSEDKIRYDDGKLMAIKTAHDYENLYVLVDVISDKTPSPMADRGMICIDSKADKTVHADDDDYCFLTSLKAKNPITLNGGTQFIQNANFKKVDNHSEFKAVGGISNGTDRYSKIPHATYEFKIPLEVFGKSHEYGFFVQAYDYNENRFYNWPKNSTSEKYPFIPSPNQWGSLISPDKSIPEFGFPLVILMFILGPVFLAKFGIRLFVRF